MSKLTSPFPKSPMSSSILFLVRAHPQPEPKQVFRIKKVGCGSSRSGASSKDSPNSLLLSNLWEWLLTDSEQCLTDLEWKDISLKLKLSARRSLAHRTRDSACSSLPTPTALPLSHEKGGPAGQNRLEVILKDQGRLERSKKLNPAVCAFLMNFPPGWTESILM